MCRHTFGQCWAQSWRHSLQILYILFFPYCFYFMHNPWYQMHSLATTFCSACIKNYSVNNQAASKQIGIISIQLECPLCGMNVTRLGVAIGSNINREKVRRKKERDAEGHTPHTSSTLELSTATSKAGEESVQHRPEGGCPAAGSLPMTNVGTCA